MTLHWERGDFASSSLVDGTCNVSCICTRAALARKISGAIAPGIREKIGSDYIYI